MKAFSSMNSAQYVLIETKWNKISWVGTTSFMSSQSYCELVIVNLQCNGIQITKQWSDVNCVISIPIWSWSGPYYTTSLVKVGTYSVSLNTMLNSIQSKCGKKFRTRKKLRTRTLSTQWSGFVVHKFKFAVVSTLRDKFISLV